MSKVDDVKVIFLYVLDYYNSGEKLNCVFELVNYEPFEGDRVAIYKSGFSSVKDYVLFEWVSSDARKLSSVTFIDHLHITDSDFYQFCYVSGDNVILGASKLFQFISENGLKDAENLFFHSELTKENHITETLLSRYLNEIKELRKENLSLKTAIKVLCKLEDTGNQISDVKLLSNGLDSLYALFKNREKEFDLLRNRVCNLERIMMKKEEVEMNKMYNFSSSSGNGSVNSDNSLLNFNLEIKD